MDNLSRLCLDSKSHVVDRERFEIGILLEDNHVFFLLG